MEVSALKSYCSCIYLLQSMLQDLPATLTHFSTPIFPPSFTTTTTTCQELKEVPIRSFFRRNTFLLLFHHLKLVRFFCWVGVSLVLCGIIPLTLFFFFGERKEMFNVRFLAIGIKDEGYNTYNVYFVILAMVFISFSRMGDRQ